MFALRRGARGQRGTGDRLRQSARSRGGQRERNVLEQPVRIRGTLLGERGQLVSPGPDKRNFEGLRDHPRGRGLQRNDSSGLLRRQEVRSYTSSGVAGV